VNGYVCFYNQQRIEVQAETSYAAQCEAGKRFKLPAKSHHRITVMLVEKDGETVYHMPGSIG
jgi:hypothetical protein